MMYDRAQTDNAKREMYGTTMICQLEGTLSPGELVDPVHDEDRRAALGLIPLTTYLRMAAVLAPDFCKVTSCSSGK